MTVCVLYTLSSALIHYIALPPFIQHACIIYCLSAPITILVGVFRRVYSFARVFLRSTARSATRPLRSSFSLRHCPSSLPMFLIYFLRIKFSQFCRKTHDASVARRGINIRFNFEFQHILKIQNTCSPTTLLNTLTKFSGEISVVGDLLTALKLTVGYGEDARV